MGDDVVHEAHSAPRRRVAACLLALVVGCATKRVGPKPAEGAATTATASSEIVACPAEMAHVDAFCVDRWEASLVEIDDGGEREFPFNRSPKDRRVRAVSRGGVEPQGYVSWNDAAQACAVAGKRLCTEHEWVRACEGDAKTKFPYGNARRARVCNDSGTNAMLRMPPERRALTIANMNDPRLLLLPDTVAKTGAFEGCTNAFGVYDMVGNLHEWVAEGVPPEEQERDGYAAQAFCGGFFLDTAINGDGCAYKTRLHADWYHDYSTGFRCCGDARATTERP